VKLKKTKPPRYGDHDPNLKTKQMRKDVK